MSSKLTGVKTVLTRYSTDNSLNFSSEMRKVIESFSDKDKMELMALSEDGKIMLTSSGFTTTSTITSKDFKEVFYTDTKTGYSYERLKNGERVMAVSALISDINNEYSVIRVVASLSNINSTINWMILIITLIIFTVFLLVFLTGTFFLRSILKPVKSISGIAMNISKGDFNQRIEKVSDDEIGDLIDAVNNMANELSVTETAKNDFISSISHELRTPLTAVKGWGETIYGMFPELTPFGIDDVPPPPPIDENIVRKGLAVIIKESDRLEYMLGELLDFSRIQSGRLKLKLEKTDVIAELQETILAYTERAKRDGIQINYESSDIFPIINGDRNRIQQVFTNIIDNALKYSDYGKGIIDIAVEMTENEVQVSIKDNGIGIKPEDLPNVKTKFFKADTNRKGSGIGLAITDEIVKMHGGVLEINSVYGSGTEVIIALPLFQVAESIEL
jgi:signal transduction histidine kinase